MTQNPINPPNDRIAGYCQAVLYKERLTTRAGGEGGPTDSRVLKGVQSVGVSRSLERESFPDIGRYGREYGRYGKTIFTINISRVLSKSSDFFYSITNNGEAPELDSASEQAENNYLIGHMFSVEGDKTIGVDGIQDRLKNYDITLMYGRDDLSHIGATPYSLPAQTGINHTTYRACLLTNISYSIPISGPVTEELTFTAVQYTQNDETDPANWTYLNNQGEDGYQHSLIEDPGESYLITNPDSDPLNPPEIANPLWRSGPFGTGLEKTFKRQDLSIGECEFPLEVIEAFQIDGRTGDIDPKTGTANPIMALQQIEVNIEISYSDPFNMGSWRGDGSDETYSRTNVNLFRQVELPVGVSCTFTGLIGAQYFSKFQFNENTGTTSQNHEVTDTYNTAGNYGDETKNFNYPSEDPDPARFVEQYKADREVKLVMYGQENQPATTPITYEKWQINLGKRNYISSFEVTGGDADGGNVEVSMSFQNDWAEFFLFKHADVLDFEPPSTDPVETT